MEEVDEFGIPIKKQTSAPAKEEVDDFGIPIKKKYVLPTPRQMAQVQPNLQVAQAFPNPPHIV